MRYTTVHILKFDEGVQWIQGCLQDHRDYGLGVSLVIPTGLPREKANAYGFQGEIQITQLSMY